ncbi:MAG: hypothetical protein JZU49_03265 [Sulfuricurvum sp.]|nr:hypothetical protein [Sulfuricurvum sp.]
MVKTRHLEIASGKRQRQKLTKKITTETGKAKLKAVAPPDPIRKEASANGCMRTLRAVLNYAFEDEEGGTPYINPVILPWQSQDLCQSMFSRVKEKPAILLNQSGRLLQ